MFDRQGGDAAPEPQWPEPAGRSPDFRVETTRGKLRFATWAAGHWVYLFSFPSTFASVCSTELVALARRKRAFEARGVRVMGITGAGLQEVADWVMDLEKVFGLEIGFPVAADEGKDVLRALGMIGGGGDKLKSRQSLFLDPERRLRMRMDYPLRLGRNSNEVLRCFEGMKDADYTGLAIPGDWQPGDDMVAPRGVQADQMQEVFGEDWTKLSEYLMIAHVSAAD